MPIPSVLLDPIGILSWSRSTILWFALQTTDDDEDDDELAGLAATNGAGVEYCRTECRCTDGVGWLKLDDDDDDDDVSWLFDLFCICHGRPDSDDELSELLLTNSDMNGA